MEYCLNDQTIPFKSYAKKSPPLRKTASELSIYVCSKPLILPEWTITRPFCCILSCNGKSTWDLELSELFCGKCWLIRQIDSTLPVVIGFLHRNGSIQNRTTLRLISIFATIPSFVLPDLVSRYSELSTRGSAAPKRRFAAWLWRSKSARWRLLQPDYVG